MQKKNSSGMEQKHNSNDLHTPEANKALNIAKEKTFGFARDITSLFKSYASPVKNSSHVAIESPYQPYRHSNRLVLALLKISPYFLIILFFVSFFWDFEHLSLTLLGSEYQFKGLLKILSVSGLIGFSTNWLAINMLFKPAKKRPLLGQGLIPSQKERIAHRLASGISRDLINPELIKKKIHESQVISRYRQQSTRYVKQIIDNADFRSDLKVIVTQYIEDMVADPTIRSSLVASIVQQIEKSLESASLERIAYKTYTLMKGREAQLIVEEALEKLPKSVEMGLDKIDEVLDKLPSVLDENSENIEEHVTKIVYKLVNKLDVQQLVEQNIRDLDEKRLEKLIKGSTNEQLHYIQYLGAILGTIGGFVIWSPFLSLSVLAVISALFITTDTLLLKWHRSKS